MAPFLMWGAGFFSAGALFSYVALTATRMHCDGSFIFDRPVPVYNRLTSYEHSTQMGCPDEWTCVFRWRNNVSETKPHPLVAKAARGEHWGSQCSQDRVVASIFRDPVTGITKRNGYFLDLASNDPIELSNTLTLEQAFGWRGLCVEANPRYGPGYADRYCQLVQAVVGQHDGDVVNFNFRNENAPFGGIEGFDNKGVNGTSRHSVVSLNTLLRTLNAPRVIDYFSLDVEGAEYFVMEKFNFSAHVFLVLTVERPLGELRELLRNQDYEYLCTNGEYGDELWVHKSMPHIDALRKTHKHKDPTHFECLLPV